MNELIIGQLIKQIRIENELSMIEFSKRIGISQSSLSRYENGSRELPLPLLFKICDEFNMTLSDFFYQIEGNNKFHEIQFDFKPKEPRNIEDELEDKLNKMISNLTINQKKALYVLLLSNIKE